MTVTYKETSSLGEIKRVWNQLLSNVVEADTLGSFKKLLDEILGSISYKQPNEQKMG
ncbi:UNVERIFIED_CONTAM: hypothetical protein FKN15_067480 [Acipenser sinensis]